MLCPQTIGITAVGYFFVLTVIAPVSPTFKTCSLDALKINTEQLIKIARLIV